MLEDKFELGDKVEIYNLEDDQLNGQCGVLVGTSANYLNGQIWIVELETPYLGRKCITIPFVCLKPNT